MLFVVLFAPVTLLVLLPIGLGLERYVMTGDSMDGAIGRGSIAFERVVPVSDVRVGDVVTYQDPRALDEDVLVTHRVIEVHTRGIRTQGDAEAHPDPWLLRPDSPTISRVEFTVPWVGWAYLFVFQPEGWLLVAASAFALVLVLSRRLQHGPTARRGAVRTGRSPGPVPDRLGAADTGLAVGTREEKR